MVSVTWLDLLTFYCHDVEQYCDSGTGLHCITQTVYSGKQWGYVVYDYKIYSPTYF